MYPMFPATPLCRGERLFELRRARLDPWGEINGARLFGRIDRADHAAALTDPQNIRHIDFGMREYGFDLRRALQRDSLDRRPAVDLAETEDRKSTRLNSSH